MTLSRRRAMQSGLAAAGVLAAPAARSQRARVLRFVPQADLTVVDPIWTTATVTSTHASMVFDTLYGVDRHHQGTPIGSGVPRSCLRNTWRPARDPGADEG